MKGSDLELGQRIWEESYSAGRIVALSDSSDKTHLVYALLRSDDGEYTIYTFERNCNCGPRVSRKIPEDAFLNLMSVLIDGIDLPDEKKVPVNVKRAPNPVVIEKTEEKETKEEEVVEEVVEDTVSEENIDDVPFIGIDVTMSVV